jgi:hypothetical protein
VAVIGRGLLQGKFSNRRVQVDVLAKNEPATSLLHVSTFMVLAIFFDVPFRVEIRDSYCHRTDLPRGLVVRTSDHKS